MIADDKSLGDILNHLCISIDVPVSPSVTTVLLMDPDGKHLWPSAGPSVPREWISTISPVPVAMAAGLCGTAAFLKETVPTNADLALIEGAGRIALIAIERNRAQAELAEALTELKSERDRLSLLLDVPQALVANLDLPGLFEAVAASLRRVTGCDLIGLALPKPDGKLRQRLVDYGKAVRRSRREC